MGQRDVKAAGAETPTTSHSCVGRTCPRGAAGEPFYGLRRVANFFCEEPLWLCRFAVCLSVVVSATRV